TLTWREQSLICDHGDALRQLHHRVWQAPADSYWGQRLDQLEPGTQHAHSAAAPGRADSEPVRDAADAPPTVVFHRELPCIDARY
ncbi:MAG: hypothetical protein JJ867_03105, partial [Marinobacter sp.]|nr:hypothetical protein [Marinobacter sp.]